MGKAAALNDLPVGKTAVVTRLPGLSLPCLILLLLDIAGAGAQEDNFQLLQPQDPVSVPAGGTLTLTCSVSGTVLAGPVKWFKGSGSGRQLVYAETGSFPRVTRAVPGSSTDFTICIRDTRPEDAGVYRCVKFKKGAGDDEEFRSGPGTNVSLSARPSAPSVSGPPGRAEPGSPVTFTCTSGGFSPRDIAVTWLRNGAELRATQTQVLPEHWNVTYSVSSTVGVTLTPGDVRSQLTCQIRHSSLSDPLNGTYSLSDALRVPPRLRVTTDPPLPVPVNESVTFTCSAEQFYPQSVSLTWLENGAETDQGKSSPPAENPDGTYMLRRSLEVKATEQKDQSVFTCRLVHDSQPPVTAHETLRILQPTADAGQSVFASSSLWIGIFLEKVLTATFLLFLFLK